MNKFFPAGKSGILVALFLFAGLGDGLVYGQFYNGHQMTFGKNRVQYNNFYWSYYRFERFDTYFTQDGNELALYAESVATPELDRIEGFFDYAVEKRIIFIIYNKLTDFRQGNIGLITGIDEYNIGGVTRIVDNKVFLYFDGDHETFKKQIRASIAEIVLNEMLYGSTLRTNMSRSSTINMPEWFNAGLISYISEPWSVEMDDRIKNGIADGRYGKFTRLSGDHAVWAGHSFWRFIEKEYGAAVISNIVYITRLHKDVKRGFMAVLGSNLKGLSKEWRDFYAAQYAGEDHQPYPETPAMVKKPRKFRIYDRMKISPDGRYMAYVTNDMGKYRIWLHNMETGKRKRIFTREQKLEQIQDYSYPALAWHPSGNILLFIYEEKGGLRMTFYDVAQDELQTRNLLYFEKVLSMDFSPDGGKLVMSASRFGRSDIYVHTLSSATSEAITDDLADDFDPKFVQNGSKIIFSSTRTDDSIRFEGSTVRRLSPNRNLFIAGYTQRKPVLTPLDGEQYANRTQPIETGKNQYAFLGDRSGVVNRYTATFDSMISFIDTAIHYRYVTRTRPLSNYSRNILHHDVDAERRQTVSLFRDYDRLKTYVEPLTGNDTLQTIPVTAFRQEIIRKQRIADSIDMVARNAVPAVVLGDGNILTPEGDTIRFDRDKTDIYRYVFEVEKLNFYQNEFELTDYRPVDDSVKDARNRIHIYQPAFYPNYLVSQADFSFLETSYQSYTGGAVYYNPGFNMLFKLGTNDLFEDYKIIGGVRFGLDFNSNEFLLSFENLKHRLDRQVIFHRQAFENYATDNYNYYPLKTHTHELFYSLRYPFTQTFAVKGTASFRDDRTVFLSDYTIPASLTMPNYHRIWAGLKLELIFDNIRKIGVNIPSGSRYKVFGETYRQLNESSDLFVIGADFRHYQEIHRNLIWAGRFAASSSFGRSRLLYYLGSLDNWITFLSRRATFDNSVRVDHQENYAYQTLATNMRGFIQNIRNGNNFALINNEIRWPFIQYFANYPLSNFWSSLQMVGFFDMG
ncbi:MAG: hypothetical protein LBR08_10130, partial [Bacteroidales bacterium]|nr:hypothetical protein [Bacteroidales bacterium]